MMEGLSKEIKLANAEGRIEGLKLTLNGDTLTHQHFLDDTMPQGTPTVKEAKAFKQILNDFSMAAGTEVSLTKLKIFFFNTHISIQRNHSRILSFHRYQLPSKYMGIHLTDKPLSREVYIWEYMGIYGSSFGTSQLLRNLLGVPQTSLFILCVKGLILFPVFLVRTNKIDWILS